MVNGDSAALAEQQEHRKVFSARSRKQLHAGSTARSVSAGLALLVLAASGVPEGWRLADVIGSSMSEATRLLLPVALR